MAQDDEALIMVTGGTGTIGSELVRLLSAAGATVRATYRTGTHPGSLSGVSWIRADLDDPRQLQSALSGTRRLLLLTGNQLGFASTQIGVIRAAERAEIEHVVKLSALGASDHSNSAIGRDHWTVEQALVASGLGWTILRPHAFMQNWLDDVARTIRSEQRIYAPIADGRVPFIDTRDIAAVAAEILLHPGPHGGKKYVLTGGEAVGYADLAAAISAEIGRRVEYHPISMEAARSRLMARGTPEWIADATLAIAAYQKAGGPTAVVSSNVQRILGRPPRTIRDFVRDHIQYFN